MVREDEVKSSFEIKHEDLQFIKEKGRGGFGVVWKGKWGKFEKVAIKQLISKTIPEELKKEFITECQSMAAMQSNYIVRFKGYCMHPEPCIVMEYMTRGSLCGVLRSNEPLEWSVRIKIATDMAKGLAFLHDKRFLHRDIKSLNVLLDEHFNAKLCDFGLAKVKIETRLLKKPQASDAAGTPAWMAPELLSPPGKYTFKSDIYSLGVTFWELGARRTPFSNLANRKDMFDLFDLVKKGKREDISPDCPKELATLIQECWDLSQDKRPSADAVVIRLVETITPAYQRFKEAEVNNRPRNNVPNPNPAPIAAALPVPRVGPIVQPVEKEPAKELVFKTLQGHAAEINALQLIPRVAELLTASADKTIKHWDLRTGNCLKTLVGHNQGIYCLQLASDGTLVSGSRDKTIKHWNLKEGTCKTLEGHENVVRCLQLLSGDRLASGSYDKTIKIWDLKTGNCLQTLKGHTAAVDCFLALPDNCLVSGSKDKTIKIWNLETGQCLKTLKGHTDNVRCFQLFNGNLISASMDKTIKIWDLKTGNCLKTLIDNAMPDCIQLLSDALLASGSWDSTLRIWDLNTGSCLKTLEAHTGRVTCLQQRKNVLVSGSEDNTIKLWNLQEFSHVLKKGPGLNG